MLESKTNTPLMKQESTSPAQDNSNTGIQVSVLVPVYNTGKCLQKCLDTLAAQDCVGIEFICVNDGSTDKSGTVLDQQAAKDNRFRVIHQANGGYGKAMNLALSAARGAYIGIVEPDDWVESDMFSRLLQLARNTNADIAKANYCIERKNLSRPNDKFRDIEEGSCFSPTELPEYLRGAPSIWSAIYRTDWLREHNIQFSETPGASFQDLGFFIRTWLAARSIALTRYAPYHYWEDNPTSSSRKMEDGAWAAFRELQLLSEVFSSIPEKETLVRSHIVFRIFATLRADYRLRIRDTVRSFLLKYSHMLNEYFPLNTLCKEAFTKNEWHDLQLIYNTPLTFPRKSKTRVNTIQRIISYRKEANHHVFRLLGMTLFIPKKGRKTPQHPQVVQLSDGLGNQLFQYAFALALKKHTNKAVMLDVSWFPEFGGKLRKATPRRYGLKAYQLTLPFVPLGYTDNTIYGTGLIGKFRKRLHLRKPAYIRERNVNLGLNNLSNLPTPAVIRGFFQRACYANTVRSQLLKDLKLSEESLNPQNRQMLQHIKEAGKKAVMVHIRRGDYLTPQVHAVHGSCDASYYRRAEELLEQKLGTPLHLFIFTDDPLWAKENYETTNEKTLVDINGVNEAHLDINLMRHCSHAIIANSTFSWWGAWLIEAPECNVIAPASWYADGRMAPGLIPDSWHTI